MRWALSLSSVRTRSALPSDASLPTAICFSLPTVGSYVFAAKSFMVPIPGFQVYNIEDQILTTDVPGWFGRWLLSQTLKANATKIDVTYQPSPRRLGGETVSAAALAFFAHVPAIVLSALLGD